MLRNSVEKKKKKKNVIFFMLQTTRDVQDFDTKFHIFNFWRSAEDLEIM